MSFTQEDEPPVSEVAREVALRNPIVLDQIFKHSPSNHLISSCSFVNKTWCRITRTALRDHGKCVVRISSHQAYHKIQKLEKVCEETEQEGRVVPFNGLKIYGCTHLDDDWLELHPEQLDVYRKMTRLMKLRHLEVVSSQVSPLCPLQDEILAWILSGQCSQLRSLNIENPIFFADLFNPETTLKFPQLEIVTIPDLPFDGEEEYIKRMLAAAPNLKRIIAKHVDVLNCLPSDKYNLLVKMPFQVKNAEHEALFRKIAEAKPKLAELLYIPPSAAVSDYDHDEDEDSVAPAVQQRSDNMLEMMLQTCHETLEYMRVIGLLNPLGRLSFPPLTKLTKISMEKWSWTPTGIEKFWRDISSIDFRRNMPALEEIEIIDTTRHFVPDDSQDLTDEVMIEWPTSRTGPLVPPECNSNAHKLTLELWDKNLNLIPIKSLVPNLTSLELKICPPSGLKVDIAPFTDIWKFWPELLELKVNVGAGIPNRNYDADFCGIHEEEAQILRGKDEEYLQNVQIVPVRPSVLTMTRLRKLTLEFKFSEDRKDPADSTLTFISNATQILAFRRIIDRTDVVLSGIPMLQTN